MKAGYEDDIIAAGILHDCVEDTELTIDQLKNVFGLKIASIVEGCSEPDKSLPWETRKEHSIEFLKGASEDIRAVACADKLHNIKSIIADFNQEGDKVWQRFNRGKVQQEWYYRSIAESLGHISRFPLVDDLKEEINRLFY
ncbi:HD domain-containing protein [Mesobacillus foraminis]|uniref:HD domain-containing protein n=1 Tax=Mesobacillus foraminis TaxID=279826 RepID=UPI0039A3EF68